MTIIPTSIVPLKAELRHAENGAMEIIIDEFVYVRINYDYRYTDNAHRLRLAEQILSLICPGDTKLKSR